MSFFKPIWQIFISIWQWLKTNNWNVLLGIFIALGIVGGIDGYFYCKAIGNGTPISLADFAGGILAIIGILLLSKRTFNQDRQLEIQSEQLQKQDKQLEYQQKQIQFQVDKEVDDRFTSAITLLGSNQTSARTGALYVLYDLAIKNDKYSKQVAEIICAHIRGHTQMPDYKKENKEKPSDEIQTAINLLFKDMNGTKGIYCQDFAKNLSDADLSHSYLLVADFSYAKCQGANFRSAECQGANFSSAECQGANFRDAQCQGADFIVAQCQGADFIEAKCQGADFSYAECQGAYFMDAHCQGADFIEAKCQGANFSYAKCHCAHFSNAECQGANFSIAECQGAHFIMTKCQGGYFTNAKCHGANFSNAECQGADFMVAQCQGAIASEENYRHDLSARVGMDTVLKSLVFSGGLKDDWLDKLQSSVKFCGSAWFEDMKKIYEEHRDKTAVCKQPEYITPGVLEDTEEIRQIIAEIKKIRSGND